MVTKEQACTLLDLIECVTDCGNWFNIVSDLKEWDYNGKDIEEATGALAKLAHRNNPISAEDF